MFLHMLLETCLTDDLRHISDNYHIRFEDIMNVITHIDTVAVKSVVGLQNLQLYMGCEQ
jgi:hypothetical protein